MPFVDKFSSYFLKKLIKTAKYSGLLTWGDRVIVAVSGGVDSAVLFSSLYELRHYFGISIACASFNHKIRASSGEDILFVAGLCKKFSIPFYTESKDVKLYAKDNKLNLEEAARILRYGFLMRAAADFKAEKIAVAHHLDDFSENFIMRLISGGGTGALAGFKVKSGIAIRPLINHSKSEIKDFANKNSIKFVEDCTNADTKILRNFVRLNIMPSFKERNPNFLETVKNTAEILRKDDDFIQNTADKLFKDIAKYANNEKKIICRRGDLIQVEDALLYRFLKISVSHISKADFNNNNNFFIKKPTIYYNNFKAFVELVKTEKPNTYFYINSSIAVRREYDKIIIENVLANATLTFGSFNFEIKGCAEQPPDYLYVIGGDTRSIKINEISKTFYIEKLDSEISADIKNDILNKRFNFKPDAVYFDFDKIIFPVSIRTFKAGDRFNPIGIDNNKKLKEYFIDKKVPANIRKTVPIILFGNTIAWVSYNTVSGLIGITESTKNVGLMKIK
jgi:tRNA(Ile)-lysidine synthase